MITIDTAWSLKYRPQTIADCVLPKELKAVFTSIVEKNDVPNMLLVGRPGIGKTTVAKALCNELGCDVLFINGSKDSGIDTLRNKIEVFASTISLSGNGKKIVIWDEGDYLSNASQGAARSFFETYSKNCRFIITANYKKRIIDPLLSRLNVIEFSISAAEKQELAMQILKRIFYILETEGYVYDKKVVGQLVLKYFPDFRKMISELQKYAETHGKIDVGLLAQIEDVNVKELMIALRDKNFPDMRKWVTENLDSDPDWIIRTVFDSLDHYLEKSSVPQAILILADYQYKSSFVADHELNLTAMFIEIMASCAFKG